MDAKIQIEKEKTWNDIREKAVFIEDKIHAHLKEEKPELFKSFDGGSTELEYLDLLHYLVKAVKPNLVLETGSFKGFGSLAIAFSLRENGLGKLVTIDIEKHRIAELEEKIRLYNLADFIETHCIDSIEYCNITSRQYDIVFFDSDIAVRPYEFRKLHKKKAIKNLAIFHDTSIYRSKTLYNPHENNGDYLAFLRKLQAEFGGINFPLSRGLQVFQISD